MDAPYSAKDNFVIGEIEMTMNKILSDIVIASDGTVSNPNNRSQLLRDWLSALGG